TKSQWRPIDTSKDKGHHIAGFRYCLDAFGQKFLRVPRVECLSCARWCGCAVQHAVPRHFHTADSLSISDWFCGNRHAMYSRIRSVYQLIKASTCYSLFIYGPCSYIGLLTPCWQSSTNCLSCRLVCFHVWVSFSTS